MMPGMTSVALNHELGPCQDMIASRVSGNGGGSAAESLCDKTENCQTIVLFLQIAFWPFTANKNSLCRWSSDIKHTMILKCVQHDVMKKEPEALKHAVLA